MGLSEYFIKGKFAASLAKQGQKESVKILLTQLCKEARDLQVSEDIDLLVDKHIDKILDSSSSYQVLSAVTKELWSNIEEKIQENNK